MQQYSLTKGSISKGIVLFAIPLFLGNLFQQLYNMADSLIVGNFLGNSALAAVTSTGSLIFLLVGFFNGTAMGAGVVISRYFGAHKEGDHFIFRVFAPGARGVTVMGEFSSWREIPMYQENQSGVYISEPIAAKLGQMYKYCIYTGSGCSPSSECR